MTKSLTDALIDFDTSRQSLELAQLVQDVIAAKRALAGRQSVRRLLDDDEPMSLADDGEFCHFLAELFGAIERLENFYKPK